MWEHVWAPVFNTLTSASAFTWFISFLIRWNGYQARKVMISGDKWVNCCHKMQFSGWLVALKKVVFPTKYVNGMHNRQTLGKRTDDWHSTRLSVFFQTAVFAGSQEKRWKTRTVSANSVFGLREKASSFWPPYKRRRTRNLRHLIRFSNRVRAVWTSTNENATLLCDCDQSLVFVTSRTYYRFFL